MEHARGLEVAAREPQSRHGALPESKALVVSSHGPFSDHHVVGYSGRAPRTGPFASRDLRHGPFSTSLSLLSSRRADRTGWWVTGAGCPPTPADSVGTVPTRPQASADFSRTVPTRGRTLADFGPTLPTRGRGSGRVVGGKGMWPGTGFEIEKWSATLV